MALILSRNALENHFPSTFVKKHTLNLLSHVKRSILRYGGVCVDLVARRLKFGIRSRVGPSQFCPWGLYIVKLTIFALRDLGAVMTDGLEIVYAEHEAPI